jgi:replicative DNA helicase
MAICITESDPLKGPFSIEAEMSFLASVSLCKDRTRQKSMRAMLAPDDFYRRDNGIIFTAMARMLDSGSPLDAVLLGAEMKKLGTWDAVGGIEYFANILNTVPSEDHGEQYGKVVEELSLRRKGVVICQTAANRLMLPATDEVASATLDGAASSIVKIRRRQSRMQVFSMADMISQFMDAKDAGSPPCLLTGIQCLDDYAGLFAFGKYTIMAGRPSMGKSTFLRWLLQLWSGEGTSVGLVAVEEDRNKMAGNYLSSISGIPNDVLAYNKLSANESRMAADAAVDLSGYNWHGVDTAFDINEVCDAIDILVTEHQCKVIAVDHIHIIKPERATESEQREVKEISRRLKEQAKRHGIILIAAAQLSRPEKGKIPPAPTLTDLRASGAIEEHADAAIFLHREDYYQPTSIPNHRCDIIIAKNRNGKRGQTELYEELENQRFREPKHYELNMWNQSGN